MAVAGLALFFALAFLTLCASARAAVLLAACSGAAFVCGLFRLFRRHSLWFCTVSGAVLVGCLLFLLSNLFVTTPALNAAEENVPVHAVVKSFPTLSANKKRYYVTATVTADGVRVPGKVRLSLPAGETRLCDSAADLSPGDRISFTGTLYALGGTNSEVRRSFQSRRLFLGAYPTDRAVLTPARRVSLWARFLSLRQKAISTLRTRFSDEVSGVLISLLFGDKSFLPDGVYRAFRNAGVAHLLAVSGLHLSVWVLVLFRVLRRRCNVRLAALVCMGVTMLVMAFALFSGSVLRAGFMLLLFLLGALLRRESDGLNSLGFAVLVCLLFDPFLAGNIGFLLSVLSTASIFLFAEPLSRWLLSFSGAKRPRVRRALSSVCGVVCVSFCVSLVTAPVLIYAFGSVSLIGVLTNLLFLPLTTPLLLCAGGSLLFGGLPLLGEAVCVLTRLLCVLSIRLASLCASVPFAFLSCEKIYAVPALLFSLCACGLLWLLFKEKKRRAHHLLAASLAVLLVLSVGVPAFLEAGTARLVVMQAGQGSAVLLKKGSRAALLRFACDSYHGDLVLDDLADSGVTLFAAVLEGSENDAALCKRLAPQSVYLRGDATLFAIEGANVQSEKAFSFAGFQVRLLSDGVLLTGRGQRFFLSDANTLALFENSVIIHTDDSDTELSTAKDALVLAIFENGSVRLRGENDWHILMKKNSNAT